MNEHQVKGKVKEAAGGAQEKLGKATGNTDQQAKGNAREQEGKVQKKAGDVKQGVEKIFRKP
jgi:uncharacterized protein YjbJ (UPF0337 family)